MFVENLSKKKSARIQAMVRTARSRFLLLLFFSLSLPVASAKNITSSLPSISLWRNCRAALLKPIMSWGTEKDGDGKVSSQGWELTDPSRKAPNETWPIGFRSKVEDVVFFLFFFKIDIRLEVSWNSELERPVSQQYIRPFFPSSANWVSFYRRTAASSSAVWFLTLTGRPHQLSSKQEAPAGFWAVAAAVWKLPCGQFGQNFTTFPHWRFFSFLDQL